MTDMNLMQSTRKHLNEVLPDISNTDAQVRALLREEYLRRLGRYRRVNERLWGINWRLSGPEF